MGRRSFAAFGVVASMASVLALGCASAPPPRTASLDCPRVIGSELVLAPGAVVVLAEVPGTVEIPEFAAALACQSLAHGKPVTLALDLPREERAQVDRFLASDGSPAAVQSLLEAPSWRQRESSLARLELLDWVRGARADGQPIWVVLLDSTALPADSSASEREREHRMAAALLAAVEATPRSVVIGLVGNPHARLVRDTAVHPPYPPMSYLVQRGLPAGSAIFALDARFPAGEAWTCSTGAVGGCGPTPIAGRGEPGAPFEIVLGGNVDRTFNGFYRLPSLSASPPAASGPGAAVPQKVATASEPALDRS